MSKRSYKIKISRAGLEEIAEQNCHEHAPLISGGYKLSASSGLWQKTNGSVTARFVYRMRSRAASPYMSSVTLIYRGLWPHG